MTKDNIFFDTSRLKHLGKNVIIGKTVRIRRPELVEIGDNSIIDDFTYISTALRVGKNCHIAANVNISGGSGSVVMGDYVAISAGCSIHAGSSDYLNASLDFPSVPSSERFGGITGDVQLADFCILGAHTVVMPGVKLPEGCAAGAQTVLRNKKYDEWTLYSGAEGKKLCRRNNKKLKNYIDNKKV
jgi:dTDP-4-amino-4,6-dideoxy-D-glucose acyltransferase